MKLQILIPQYKETEEIIKPLLDSIEIQQNVDLKNEVGVVIVNDGTDVHLSREFLDRYTYHIDYYLNDHKGVSATRNACLDYATADYVMFCDADDMFANVYGLWLLFREIENGGFDSLTSVFIEETRLPNTKTITYIERGRAEAGGIDCTFVHGKVHRRKYLLENNIRWNDNLTIHEDSYFNCLCQRLAKELKYSQTSFGRPSYRKECRNLFRYLYCGASVYTYKRYVHSDNECNGCEFLSALYVYSFGCPQYFGKHFKRYRFEDRGCRHCAFLGFGGDCC
jgi:glycosyltransferase involved in cell wall biosynthesis